MKRHLAAGMTQLRRRKSHEGEVYQGNSDPQIREGIHTRGHLIKSIRLSRLTQVILGREWGGGPAWKSEHKQNGTTSM